MTGKRSINTQVVSELLEFWPSIGRDFAEIVADRVLKIPLRHDPGTFLDAAVKSLQMSNDNGKSIVFFIENFTQK